MDAKNTTLLIISILILLLVFPIFFEVKISFNPFKNRGVVALFLFKKKLIYYYVEIHGKYVVLVNDTETKREEVEFSSQKFLIIEEFLRQLKNKVRLKFLYVYYNIGLGDAFRSALLAGSVNQILNFIFINLKSRKPTASLCIYDTVSYNKVVFEMAGRMKISISLFDIAYSFAYSVILKKGKLWGVAYHTRYVVLCIAYYTIYANSLFARKVIA